MLQDRTIVSIKNANSKRVHIFVGGTQDTWFMNSIANVRVSAFPEFYFIYNFGTDHDHRNKGWATKILKYLIRKADKPIQLTVKKSNKTALHLYNKMGFVRITTNKDDRKRGLYRMRYTKKNGYGKEKAIEHSPE